MQKILIIEYADFSYNYVTVLDYIEEENTDDYSASSISLLSDERVTTMLSSELLLSCLY